MIQQVFNLPADDSDVFQTAGSQLRRAPDDGVYRMWYSSDQVDGLITIIAAGMNVLEQSKMPVKTVNQITAEGSPLVEFAVAAGDDVIVNYNEVTGGTASMIAIFLDLEDVLVEQGLTPTEVEAELRRL